MCSSVITSSVSNVYHCDFYPSPCVDAIYEEAQATRDAYCSSLLSAASALKAAAPSLAAVTATAAAASAPPMKAPPAMMSPSGFPAPMQQPLESLPSQKSPTSDACVGTEEAAFNQTKSEPKPEQKSPAPVEFKDDGSGSTDALSMMLGFIFETVFGIIYFFLIGLPVRVIKYSIILVVLYVTLATTWLYLADDNGAMDLGAMIDFAGSYQQSLW